MHFLSLWCNAFHIIRMQCACSLHFIFNFLKIIFENVGRQRVVVLKGSLILRTKLYTWYLWWVYVNILKSLCIMLMKHQKIIFSYRVDIFNNDNWTNKDRLRAKLKTWLLFRISYNTIHINMCDIYSDHVILNRYDIVWI